MTTTLTRTDEDLRQAFLTLKTPRELAQLLEIAYSNLTFHAYRNKGAAYATFSVPKKTGGLRTISAPITPLKIIQRKLNQVLTAVYEPKPPTHGFVRERNILSNASPHVGRRWVLNFEDFMRRVTAALLREIELARIPRADLRLSLLGLSLAAELEFFRDAGKRRALERWRRFATAFESTSSRDFATFSSNRPPFDGRTLRAEHFETFWCVFGLAPPVLPNATLKFALDDLALARNGVAHGEFDPLAFGRSKATPDVRRMVMSVEDLVTHVAAAADAYLQRCEFRR